MKRKFVWLVVSGLVALSMVLASCAPAPAPTTTAPATTARTTPTAPAATAPAAEKPLVKQVEKPKYGGVFIQAREAEIVEWDIAKGREWMNPFQTLSNENLWIGDWARGPAGGYGTNEFVWLDQSDLLRTKTGNLAESWEMNVTKEGMSTILFHIRKGVRWAVNPASEASKLVNGREMTAEDVLWSLKWSITDKNAYVYSNAPGVRARAKLSLADKWTIKVELPWEDFYLGALRFGDLVMIMPPEVIEKYKNMADWKNWVGTGPFMMSEVVPGASMTMNRNPNYWGKNPIGPGKGDQLPYVDAVKMLIIKDWSTLLAALRTGKIDHVMTTDWEDGKLLKKQVPQLKSLVKHGQSGGADGIAMRTDTSPFNDLRVRRAMLMAIDYNGINQKLFDGDLRNVMTWPIGWHNEYTAYLGLDDPDMPDSIKELYSYKPDKAKALLKEAGYPNGFKTSLLAIADPTAMDMWSLYKDYWSKIGVDVELKPSERTAHTGLFRLRKYEGMMTGAGAPGISSYYMMGNYRLEQENNLAYVAPDPYIEGNFTELQWLVATDEAAAMARHREIMKYVLDQAWTIQKIIGPEWRFWWPWLKNYNGERYLGYTGPDFSAFIWIDQDLKKSMGY
ncbi:MAG: ABC transporter substrate-binding protein [Chloroflexi bacterium]|nr:ABC transporter substrate-binding protein [Chloroflexota bacterium]